MIAINTIKATKAIAVPINHRKTRVASTAKSAIYQTTALKTAGLNTHPKFH